MEQIKGHEDLKIEHRQVAEKQQEFKLIGSQKRQPGQKLWACNLDTEEFYEVKIQKNDVLDVFSKHNVGALKAYVNPDHPMLWAINRKNAIRKFMKNLIKIEE